MQRRARIELMIVPPFILSTINSSFSLNRNERAFECENRATNK